MHTYKNIFIKKNTIELLHKHRLTKILLAISGGQDSMILIKFINYVTVIYQLALHIEYIYIDHQWKTDSVRQIIHLSNYLHINQANLFIYQINRHAHNENNARTSRYKILINHAINHNCQCIITAHTKTDRIETFLMNLTRGTSIDGATSLVMNRQLTPFIDILRPLMHVSRLDIKFLCQNFCLPIWSDYSNYDLNIKRNRIRNELLPYIKNYFNSKIEDAIHVFLDICTTENEYIKQNVLKLYFKSHHKEYIALNHKYLRSQHLTLQARILQLFFIYHFNIILNHNIIKYLIKQYMQASKPKIIIFMNLIIKIHAYWLYII